MQEKEYAAEYLALKAANDQLRERGKQWLFDSLNQICAEINQKLLAQGNQQSNMTGLAGAASILSGLGINPAQTLRDAFGRTVPLSTGTVRPSLFLG